MIARDAIGSRPAVNPPAVSLEPVLVALAVASTIELLVLRTVTRAAVHVPALSELQDPYKAVASFGRYSYYVAAVLLVAVLPFAVVRLWRAGDVFTRASAVAVSGFVLAAIATRSEAVDVVVTDALTIGVVVAASCLVAGRAGWRTGAVTAAFGAAFALQGTSSMLQDAAAEGIGSFETRWLLWGAEWLALVFALVAPFGLGARPSRRVSIVAAAVGLLTFAVLLANGSTTKILLLWNEGLAGTLPSVAYAAAAATLVVAVLGLLAQRRSLETVGLVLLITGGIGLHSTYQTGLVVMGMAALCLAVSEPVGAMAESRQRP